MQFILLLKSIISQGDVFIIPHAPLHGFAPCHTITLSHHDAAQPVRKAKWLCQLMEMEISRQECFFNNIFSSMGISKRPIRLIKRHFLEERDQFVKRTL